MGRLGRFWQGWRDRAVRAWVPRGARVLEVGHDPNELLPGLGDAVYPDGSFDVLVLHATPEHLRDRAQLGREFIRLLRPGGRAIVSVPSARGRRLAAFLQRDRSPAADFDPLTTPRLFGPHGFVLEYWQSVQLGCGYLFVFHKPADVLAGAGRAERPEPVGSVVHV